MRERERKRDPTGGTSILSTESTINKFPVQRLRRNTLCADVLSVKQFPKQLFLQKLPDNFDILCLHPMFGPDSGKGSWKDLPLVRGWAEAGGLDLTLYTPCSHFSDSLSERREARLLSVRFACLVSRSRTKEEKPHPGVALAVHRRRFVKKELRRYSDVKRIESWEF